MDNTQVANRIKELCKLKGSSVSKMLEVCNIRKSLIYDLEKRNASPSIEVIGQIADYLNCSVDYLFGRTDNPEVTYNNHALSGDGGVAVAGGNANIAISDQQKEDTELLNLIKSLSLKKRVKIISMIYEELEEETK